MKHSSMNISMALTKDHLGQVFNVLFSVARFTKKHVNAYLMIDCDDLSPFYKFFEDYKIDNLDVHLYDSKELDGRLSKDLSLFHSKMTYARILLLKHLPKSVKRVLQLDDDLLVVQPGLDEMYDIDLEGNVAAAVEDVSFKTYNVAEIKNCQTDFYFNSGVVLMDLDKLRKQKTIDQMVDWLSNPPSFMRKSNTFIDQSMMNMAFSGKVKALDPKYNVYRHLITYKAYDELSQQFGYKTQLDVIKNAVIMHFVGEKPWNREKYAKWQINQLPFCMWQFHFYHYINYLVSTCYIGIQNALSQLK